MPVRGEDTTTVADEDAALPAGVAFAVQSYAKTCGLTADATADCTWTVWTGDENTKTWTVTLSSADHPEIVHHLWTDEWSAYLFYTEGPDGKTFPCDDIDID